MGSMLSNPVELVHVQRKGSSAFRCAVAEMQGWRNHHEDAHAMKCNDRAACFWVLDGHGGDGASLFSAPMLEAEAAMLQNFSGAGKLPSDKEIEGTFALVDEKLRRHLLEFPEKDSGTTVVGAMAALAPNGTYTIKLLNCGDSRAMVVRGPSESEGSSKDYSVSLPEHLSELLAARDETKEVEDGILPAPCWPVVTDTIDHKPSHPTERRRIEAAGGFVSDDFPPRLDGNLAVSRGLGDFYFKGNIGGHVKDQKVSCVPDIYSVSGIEPGSLLILACDGIWDVMSSEEVGEFFRKELLQNPRADLGDAASELLRTALKRNSRDNMTVMVVQLSNGSDWAHMQDEMRNHAMLSCQEQDEDAHRHNLEFLRKSNFPLTVQNCAVCDRWHCHMNMCPCETVYYCTKRCQKQDWKAHKPSCTAKQKLEEQS